MKYVTSPRLRRSLFLGGSAALLGVLLALFSSACSTGEGERCNPDRYSDECGAGLRCTTPTNCAVSVCCPLPNQTVPGPDVPAECLACAADAGTGGGGGAGGSMPDAGAEGG
jgi:hypothetical protein